MITHDNIDLPDLPPCFEVLTDRTHSEIRAYALAAVEAVRKRRGEPVKVPSDPAVAAIQFALQTDEALPFLQCWNEGNFDTIRREWPEAPEEVFIGADPMHPETRAILAHYGQHAQPAKSSLS